MADEGGGLLGLSGSIKAFCEMPAHILEGLEKAANAWYRIRQMRQRAQQLAVLEVQQELQQQEQQQQRQQQEQQEQQQEAYGGGELPQVLQSTREPRVAPDGTMITFRADGTMRIFYDVSSEEEAAILSFNEFLTDMQSNCQSIKDIVLQNRVAFRDVPNRAELLDAMNARLRMVHELDNADSAKFSEHAFRQNFFSRLKVLTDGLVNLNKEFSVYIADERRKLDIARGLKSPD